MKFQAFGASKAETGKPESSNNDFFLIGDNLLVLTDGAGDSMGGSQLAAKELAELVASSPAESLSDFDTWKQLASILDKRLYAHGLEVAACELHLTDSA